MGRFDRLQGQVERLEARVRSYEVGEAAPSPWEAEPAPSDPAVEADLEALTARVGKPAANADAEAPQTPAADDAEPEAPRSA